MKIKFEPNEFEVGKQYQGKIVEIGGVPIPADGTLLQVKGQPEVWYMMGGKRRHITTLDVFNKMAEDLGFKWGDQEPITQEDLQAIPLGDPITNWPEVSPPPPISPIRMMYGVMNTGDLERAKESGCNTVFSTNFDSKGESSQKSYINKCKELGLKVCWNLWGGDWAHRDETIRRWKDDPAIFAWYYITEPSLPGGGSYLTADEQRERYNKWKAVVGPNNKIPFMQDRSIWNVNPDYWAEDALDIIMPYSYAYQEGIELDTMYNRMFANLTTLKTRAYPIIPLFQCFWAGKYQKPPVGGVRAQYDRWKTFLESKGWFGGHCAFYVWSGYDKRDIKNNQYLYDEIKELNKSI